ncbi:MAG: hypothetical protein F6K23_30245 [Okeania sp. SIO2C9]|uniref:hypothetical protein n=1 Tax=Okeania sp. SIO2C9 TaxID=2607791 RepID=UPI0013C1B77E|nr:hypothetical protein [Okeania sp. SIO2C9]NEQ76931.1 hypothetical protein [Okeania sp. SIO2C9]
MRIPQASWRRRGVAPLLPSGAVARVETVAIFYEIGIIHWLGLLVVESKFYDIKPSLLHCFLKVQLLDIFTVVYVNY